MISYCAMILACTSGIPDQRTSYPYQKPRVIVTADLGADPDDEQSLVRLFVSANEFDL